MVGERGRNRTYNLLIKSQWIVDPTISCSVNIPENLQNF
jgi:hypothetical protein